MILTPAQATIAKDKHRFRVLCCGRRFGKTVLAVEEMVGVAIVKKNRRISYYAPTRDDARDITWSILIEKCENIITYKNQSRLEIRITTLDGGESLIVLYGWESVQERGKGRGLSNDFIVLDEISSYRNFWAGWDEVLSPTLVDRRGSAMFISTPKGFNHFFDLYNFQDKDKDYKSFHFTTYDNPHIPVDEIEREKATKPENTFAQEYLASFRKSEGLVYKEFDRARHLYNTKDVRTTLISRTMLGVDFGYTNPSSVLVIQKDNEGNYWIDDEWYRTGKTNIEIIEYCKSKKPNYIYADPAEPDRIEEMRRHNLYVKDVSKDVVAGIDKVRNLFKESIIRINRRCVNLIAELESYSYPEKRPDSNEPEKPIKENDHACFPAGTIVNGREISEIGTYTGNKRVYEYTIAGEKIQATEDHPVCTQRGFVFIDTLRYNDIICKNKLFMMVSNGTGIRTALTGLIGITSSVVKRLLQARERDYIDTSGKKKTELSRKDFIYITLTATPRIIKYSILNVLVAVNTIIFTGMTRSVNGLKKILRKLLRVLRNGVRLLRGKKDEKKSAKTIQSIFQDIKSLGNAISATRDIHLRRTLADGVITIAEQRRYVGVELVYSLRTKSGMYRVKGIIVSNCDAMRYALFMDAKAITGRKPHIPKWQGYGKAKTML